MERTLDSKKIYEGKVVRLKLDDVILDDGTKTKREVVIHHGGACIAVRSKDDKYYMVRQYRYAQGMEMLEFCAGKLEEAEDPKEAVIREANEELGVSVRDVKEYGFMVPTCGYSSERIYLYSAIEDGQIGQHLDADERLDIVKFSLEEIEEMIASGKIVDAKTICLIYHLKKEVR